MVEPLKKEDIICVDKVCLERDPYTDETENFVLVSRIKEIVKDIISFSVTTNSRTELQCKIINGFGVLFDTQSPNESGAISKDRPLQEKQDDVITRPVVVLNHKSKAFGGMRSENRGGKL